MQGAEGRKKLTKYTEATGRKDKDKTEENLMEV